jgi:C4-dicarboxylate-specific signal transduction histidine kinase
LLDGFVNVSVLDNGPGIPVSIKKEIFNPFFTTKDNGMGIGLAICRSIIEDHDGKLQCEDGESGGAVFTFKLRVVE